MLTQGPFTGLEGRPQKNGIIARRNVSAAKNFGGNETAQLLQVEQGNRLLNFFEYDCIGKHEREVAFHRRIARQRAVAYMPQFMLIKLAEKNFRDECILAQFA